MINRKQAKPTTIMIPVRNAADRKRVADLEESLSRQVGFKFVMDAFTDAQGKEYRVVGWPMRRGDRAAVAMFMRRGKKPADPALLSAAEVHEKRPVDVAVSNGLSKKKV
jgi:hypothetical protein